MEKISKIYPSINDKEELEFLSNYKIHGENINYWIELIEKTDPKNPLLEEYFDKLHNGVSLGMTFYILNKYIYEEKIQKNRTT